MSEQFNPTSQLKDFLSGFSANPNMPNLKVLVSKLSSLPGVSQFSGLQIQMLRVQEELLKGQIAIIQQVIQALEAAPEAPNAAADAAPTEAPADGKIVIS